MLESAQMLNQVDLDSFISSVNSWSNVVILIRANANIDKLAAGLSLYLALKKLGKKVQIATDTNLTVARTNLFGLGEVESKLPQVKGGNMVLTLENVVIGQGPDSGKVPALEKLDWYPEGKDLKLKFQVLPGQRFEPSNVRVDYEGGGFDGFVIIGASSLNDLGNIYSANSASFSSAFIINVDTSLQNQRFGKINLVDSDSFSVSEVVSSLLDSLAVGLDGDLANNLLAGIYNATNNLTRGVGANTFLAVGRAMQAGGKVPINQGRQGGREQTPVQAPVQQRPVQESTRPQQPTQAPVSANPFLSSGASVFNSVFSPTFEQSTKKDEEESKEEVIPPSPGLDLGGFARQQQQQQAVVGQEPQPDVVESPPVGTMGEAVGEEDVETSGEFNPAPDWLTPKVYKSGGLG